jgi:hypothetical protein
MMFNIDRLLAGIQTKNFLHAKHDKKIMYDINIMIFSHMNPYIIGDKYHSTLIHYCENLKYCMYGT